jgi:hypothetical protein
VTEPRAAALDRVLDEALGRALRGPQVSQAFRTRLRAALSPTPGTDLLELRERLESERREQLEELQAHYIRVRRSTLGGLIGVAFAAGAVATIAMPWLRAHLGGYAPLAITWGAVTLGLGMVFLEPLRAALRHFSEAG